MELSDLPKGFTGRNPGGMASELLLIPVSKIEDYPGPPSPSVVPGDSISIDGPITVVDPLTDGFISVYITAKTAKMIATIVGQKDSKGMTVDFEFFHPSLSPAFIEALLLDEEYVAAVKKPNCDDKIYTVIGTPCNGGEITGAYDSGMLGEAEARNGWAAKYTWYGDTVRTYDSTTNPIPLKPV